MSKHSSFRFFDDIEVKQNVRIEARERGKLVTVREGHNIFVDLGREWLSKLICYLSFSPDVTEEDARVRYMGFGIGGTRQVALGVSDAAPIGGGTDAYRPSYGGAGANIQTDIDPLVTTLERPVRISGGTDDYPGVASDAWIGQVQAPVTHSTSTSATFRRLFTGPEISYDPYVSVPLSEVGLFTSAASTSVPFNTLIAYDTFDTLSKTTSFELEVVWTLRF